MRHEIIVPGTPVSVNTQSRRRLQEWKDLVSARARLVVPEDERIDFVDVNISIVWYCHDWREGDLDNIGKPILDALERYAFFNDNQVVQLTLRRTDIAQRETMIVEDASPALADQLLAAHHSHEPFVYLSITDDAIDHASLA